MALLSRVAAGFRALIGRNAPNASSTMSYART